MPELYDRKYKLQIVTYRGEVIEISAELRMTFNITQKIANIYQWAEIVLYNLSRDTETDILKNGMAVTLEAGYQNEPYGLIFQGPIRQPIRGKEDGTTYFLKLICIDKDDALNIGFCDFVLANGLTAQEIAGQVARKSSVPFDIQIDPGLSNQKTSRGKVVFGLAKDHLRSLALSNNANFYFHNGVAKVSQLSKEPPPFVISLNAQTGMIGFPTQVDNGICVRCLINPNIKLDNWIHLNNSEIIAAALTFGDPQTILDLDGAYRVIEIVMSGDTRGNNWYFDIQAISQKGAVPEMLTNLHQSGTQ